VGITIFLQTLINGLSSASLYILMAIGLTYVFSIMRIINFAHGEILMLGGYVIYLFVELWGLNYYISIILSLLIVGLLGMLFERFLFRPRRGEDLNLLVLSLGLGITLQGLALIFFTPEDRGIERVQSGVFAFHDLYISKMRFLSFVIAAVFIVGSQLFLKRTKAGISLEAVSQDLEAASLQGINVNRYIGLSFGVGCAFAAVAGSLLGPMFTVSPFMGHGPVVKAFIIIILGGLGSMMGAMVGGLILGIVESFGATYMGATIQEISGFLLLLLILIIKPTGIFGEKQ
jgi:branched-chain amino acid transport system permease protein